MDVKFCLHLPIPKQNTHKKRKWGERKCQIYHTNHLPQVCLSIVKQSGPIFFTDQQSIFVTISLKSEVQRRQKCVLLCWLWSSECLTNLFAWNEWPQNCRFYVCLQRSQSSRRHRQTTQCQAGQGKGRLLMKVGHYNDFHTTGTVSLI